MTDYLGKEVDLGDPALASVVDEVSVWSSRFGALLLANLEPRRGIDVLDVGCCTGFPLYELAHSHGHSSRFVGIDVWAEALRRAQSKQAVFKLPNVSLLRGDGAAMPFASESFDLIVSNLGANNFEDPETTMRECGRVARRGARIALTTNVQGHYRELYAAFHETLEALGLHDRREHLERQEAHRSTEESLTALLEGAGFDLAKLVKDVFRWRCLDGSAFLRHSLTWIGFLDGWKGVVEPSDQPRVFADLEGRLNRIADENGELVMTVPMLYVEGIRR